MPNDDGIFTEIITGPEQPTVRQLYKMAALQSFHPIKLGESVSILVDHCAIIADGMLLEDEEHDRQTEA